MATKFVSTARGNDTTGDGSATTPWKTIGKAIGSGAAFTLDTANPNTLYIEPGVYRESVPISVSPTSSGPLSIVGDVDGAGFLAGGHSSPTTGLVDWRAWSDDHTPIAASCIAVNAGHNYVSISGIKFIGGSSAYGLIGIDSSHDWTIRDCNFIGYYGASSGVIILATPTAGVPLNLTVDRCHFHTMGGGGAFNFVIPFNTTDWSINSKITNCVFEGSDTGVYYYQQFGSGSFYAGGLGIQNCTFFNTPYGVYVGGGATSSPVTVYGSIFAGGIVHADVSGQITENGNVFMQHAANENVTAGANSITAACPAFNFNDDRLTGALPRPHAEPSAVSPLKAFGNYGTTPTVDIYDQARPATASAGALEIDVFSGGGGGGGGGGAAGILNLGASMGYTGDMGGNQVVTLPFWTTATLTGGAADVLRDDGVSSTSGVTLSLDRHSTTGRNAVLVDVSDQTFYLDNHDYEVSITAGTVGGNSAVGLVGSFSLRNRPLPVKSTAFDTSGIKSVGG